MFGIKVRFNGTLFGVGTGVSGVGAGLTELVSDLTFLGAFLFLAGLPVMLAGVSLERRPKPVIVHERWDMQKIYDAMRKAPDDAVLRIRQTWIPGETFTSILREMFVEERKRFKLDVLLMAPTTVDDSRPSPLLAARVEHRDDISVVQAVEEVRLTLRRFTALRESVFKGREAKKRHPTSVDLDIRLYDSMPFGPIFWVGDSVMYVGLYINFESSENGPMLEIRNTPDNRWWRKIDREFDEAWSQAEAYIPTTAVALPAGPSDEPAVHDGVREPLQ